MILCIFIVTIFIVTIKMLNHTNKDKRMNIVSLICAYPFRPFWSHLVLLFWNPDLYFEGFLFQSSIFHPCPNYTHLF